MPRSTKSRTVKADKEADQAPESTTTTDSTDTAQENDTMSTAEAPTFNFSVEPAPEGYEPERKNPGRTRTPSPFDDILIEVKDKGWQRVPYSGEDHKKAIERELTKAKQFRNLGLDMNVTDTHVEFRSRDLQKRKARKGEQDQQELVNAQGGPDADGDNDE